MTRREGRQRPTAGGLVLVATLLGVSVLCAASGPAVVGRRAPELRLPDAGGRTVSLSDLRGKVVLVDFWASWCAPCRQSFPALTELQELFRARGLEVVAINVDQQRRDADAFLADRPRTMTIVFDPAGNAPRAFDVQGMPASFLLARDGTIRFAHEGFSDKVLDAYRREISQLLNEGTGGESR